jgi:hypothetical protein
MQTKIMVIWQDLEGGDNIYLFDEKDLGIVLYESIIGVNRKYLGRPELNSKDIERLSKVLNLLRGPFGLKHRLNWKDDFGKKIHPINGGLKIVLTGIMDP